MKYLRKNVIKPWGGFCDLVEQKNKWHLKIISVKKGHRLSLQSHQSRSEFWIIVEGKIKAQKNKKTYLLASQDYIFIKKEEQHRLTALVDAIIVEISFGSHKENDIIRFADDYGRR